MRGKPQPQCVAPAWVIQRQPFCARMLNAHQLRWSGKYMRNKMKSIRITIHSYEGQCERQSTNDWACSGWRDAAGECPCFLPHRFGRVCWPMDASATMAAVSTLLEASTASATLALKSLPMGRTAKVCFPIKNFTYCTVRCHVQNSLDFYLVKREGCPLLAHQNLFSRSPVWVPTKHTPVLLQHLSMRRGMGGIAAGNTIMWWRDYIHYSVSICNCIWQLLILY